MLFSEAIEQFTSWRRLKKKLSTVRGYDLSLRSFCLFLRNPEIEDITLENVIEWFDLQEMLGWDKNGFIGKAIAIRKILEFYQHKYKDSAVLDPWLIPVPDRRWKQARVANEEQYNKLLSVVMGSKNPIHIRNEAIIRMLWDTGARNTEVLSINIEDLDMNHRRVAIRTEKSKGKKPFRNIFWRETTNEALIKWMEKRDHLCELNTFKDPEALFTSVARKPGCRLTNKGLVETMRVYSNKAGIPNVVNAHSMRHHMGHDLAQKGVNNSSISSILGHANLTSSFVYTMLNDIETEAIYREKIDTKIYPQVAIDNKQAIAYN
ncbi:MAG: site-specific integrase [Proteiniphilum sp.]|nr:site-specific integrase [Proteiniphilum sp.]